MKTLLRKLHLWLSVPFGLLITLICFSGMTLVFERELTEWWRPGLYFVNEVGEAPLPVETLMEQVAATLPDTVSATGLTIYPDPRRTWQVGLSRPRRAALYVDPYTGAVAGRSERLPFFDAMMRLHRWLMGPSTGVGKTLTGISTVVMAIVMLTGMLMWLTNRRRPLAKGLTIALRRGWPRLCHDLHVAGGIYSFIFLMVIALTGLTWSFAWYHTGFYSLLGVEASAEAHGTHGPHADGRERGERGERGGGHDSAERHERGAGGAGGEHRRHSPYAHWQEVYASLAMHHPGYRQITLARAKAEVVPAGRHSLRAADTYDFNPRSGEITGCTPYADKDQPTRLRTTVYALHTGSWGGLPTRILTFLAALIGASLPITGYCLWLRRLRRRASP